MKTEECTRAFLTGEVFKHLNMFTGLECAVLALAAARTNVIFASLDVFLPGSRGVGCDVVGILGIASVWAILL